MIHAWTLAGYHFLADPHHLLICSVAAGIVFVVVVAVVVAAAASSSSPRPVASTPELLTINEVKDTNIK